MHVPLYWPFHAFAPPSPFIPRLPIYDQLLCFFFGGGGGDGDNEYQISMHVLAWDVCSSIFYKNFVQDCRPSCSYQKLTLSYHINCLWQIVWSRGWLCLLEFRNEKEEHLKQQEACSWSRWVDLGMSSAEGMDLELQRLTTQSPSL